MNNISRHNVLSVAKATALAKQMGVDVYSRNAVYEHVFSVYERLPNEGYTMANVMSLVEAILLAAQSARNVGIDPVEILEDEDKPKKIPIENDDIELILHHVWKMCGHPSNKDNIRKYVKLHMENAYPEFQNEIIEKSYAYYLRNKDDQDAYFNKLKEFNEILDG